MRAWGTQPGEQWFWEKGGGPSKMLLLSINIVLLLRRRPSCHAHSHPHDTVTWIAPVYRCLDLLKISVK